MIETSINENAGSTTIVLRPNNSASWQLNMQILALLAFMLLCISSYFALQGLWLIFPFAGLEVILLFFCLCIRLRANIRTEVITFNDSTVIVERGSYYAEKSWKYHRIWTKFFIKKPPNRNLPVQIFIRSHGKELELGAFLNEQDKNLLIKKLKNIVYA